MAHHVCSSGFLSQLRELKPAPHHSVRRGLGIRSLASRIRLLSPRPRSRLLTWNCPSLGCCRPSESPDMDFLRHAITFWSLHTVTPMSKLEAPFSYAQLNFPLSRWHQMALQPRKLRSVCGLCLAICTPSLHFSIRTKEGGDWGLRSADSSAELGIHPCWRRQKV